jgi:hypothetical protein
VTKQQRPRQQTSTVLPLRQTIKTTSTLTQRNPATGEWEEMSRKIDVVEVRGEFPEEAARKIK